MYEQGASCAVAVVDDDARRTYVREQVLYKRARESEKRGRRYQFAIWRIELEPNFGEGLVTLKRTDAVITLVYQPQLFTIRT